MKLGNWTKMVSFAAMALFWFSNASADVADFEDVKAGNIPATPFVSGGLLFESGLIENGIFTPDVLPGANNGTQAFAWCGSNCAGGTTQIITVSQNDGDLFDLISIDAGNLLPGGFGPGEWAPGMTIELDGFLGNGDKVSQSLKIQENLFDTFTLIGFEGLTSVEISAPPIVKDGPGPSGNPDGVIDNLVWNSSTVVPEPGTAGVATLALFSCVLRRRRS